MKKIHTFIKDITDSTASVSGEFKIMKNITVSHKTIPNSIGQYAIKSLNKTIVLRRKRDLVVPYNIDKEIKDSENLSANRGPKPSPPTFDEID